MTTTIFCKSFLGDSTIVKSITEQLNGKCSVIIDSIDLSKLSNDSDNLIIVVNKNILNFNFKQLFESISLNDKVATIVVYKLKTFGAVFFNDNYKIRDIATNKIYPFAGILYIPSGMLRQTFSETLKSLDKETLKYIILKQD